ERNLDGLALDDLVELDRPVEEPALVEELELERQLRRAPARGVRLEADRGVAVVIHMLQRAGEVRARVVVGRVGERLRARVDVAEAERRRRGRGRERARAARKQGKGKQGRVRASRHPYNQSGVRGC